ncbi:DUF106 domain-containing protein [Caldiplasma sukawensis]
MTDNQVRPTSPQRPMRPQSQMSREQMEMQKRLLKFQGLSFLILIGSLVLIYVPVLRDGVGAGFQAFLYPIIGFGYKFPALTIVMAGVITGIVTGIPRYFFTDWVKMGKMQVESMAYSDAIKKAYRENDRELINKLSKMRTDAMLKQQSVQMSNYLPILLFSIFSLLVFVWIYYFLSKLSFDYISFPWAINVNLNAVAVLAPYWLFFSFISNLIVGYVVTNVIKSIDFTYRIKKIEKKAREQMTQ